MVDTPHGPDRKGVVPGWMLDMRGKEGDAAPTTGQHMRREIVWNRTPAAGGYVGWVCVASGEPGTWKGFGLIEA